MQTFKKVLCSLLCGIVAVVIILAVLIVPVMRSEFDSYQDNALRAEMAGSIDLLVCGASQSERGIDPRVLDEELGCTSYNVSSILLNMYARNILIQKECDRNPVDTVIIDISYDALSRGQMANNAQGDITPFTRLDTASERMEYLSNMDPASDVDLLARLINRGVMWWASTILGREADGVDYAAKGLNALEPVDLSTVPEETLAVNAPSPGALEAPYAEDNLAQFDEIVAYCQANDIRLVVVSIPVSRWGLSQCTAEQWDASNARLAALCAERGLEYYDFGLYREYPQAYSDDYSFNDSAHLSTIGAEVFSHQLCTVLKTVDEGGDVASLFFSSYSDIIGR